MNNFRNQGIMAELEALIGDSESTRDTLPPKRHCCRITHTQESSKDDTGLNIPHHEAGETDVSSDSGSSDSNDPVSRKARKYIMRRQQNAQPQKDTANIATTSAITSTTDTVNPFTYAMQNGKFPRPVPCKQPHHEPPELADTGYLWNAVPPRTCQYLDLEAAHVGSETSEGSTGSSEGSLSDEDFIDKESPPDVHSAEELQVLQRLFPKTFSRENMLKRSPKSSIIFRKSAAQKDPVMVNGIIQFPVWKRGPESHHPMTSE
jgi:hypothetical protein